VADAGHEKRAEAKCAEERRKSTTAQTAGGSDGLAAKTPPSESVRGWRKHDQFSLLGVKFG
jgi:hypothetical protein